MCGLWVEPWKQVPVISNWQPLLHKCISRKRSSDYLTWYTSFCRLPTVNQLSDVVIAMLNIDISVQLSVDAQSMKTYNFMKISFSADELKCIHDILRYILL